jgi:hypothetical protein
MSGDDDATVDAFFAELIAGFTALRADESAWAAEQAERALWDGVLGDNLD